MGEGTNSSDAMQTSDFDNDTSVSDAVDTSENPVFHSDNIGTKATPEYFSNVKGGKKNQEKVENKRTRITRKTLFIILGAILGVAVIFIIVFAIINLAVRPRGSHTGESLPTTISEVEERTYKVLYSGSETGGYANALRYVNNIIADLIESESDADLTFATRAFRSRLAYEAGGHTVGINDALNLIRDDLTDTQKYIIYITLTDLYYKEGNITESDKYYNMALGLDVAEDNRDDQSPEGITDGMEIMEFMTDDYESEANSTPVSTSEGDGNE